MMPLYFDFGLESNYNFSSTFFVDISGQWQVAVPRSVDKLPEIYQLIPYPGKCNIYAEIGKGKPTFKASPKPLLTQKHSARCGAAKLLHLLHLLHQLHLLPHQPHQL